MSGYDLTLYLPLPSFWAARVPNQVLSEDSYERSVKAGELNIAQRLKHFDYRQDWLRDLGSVYQTKINHMISEWHELGIIAKTEDNAENNKDGFLPDTVWKETGRKFGEEDPTFAQVVRAETITDGLETKAKKATPDTVGLLTKNVLQSAKAASHSSESKRKRRKVSRGER